MANKLTLSDIFNIIDDHFDTNTSFLFVTTFDLAENISEYICDNYDLIDEDMSLNNKIKEYYVSVYFNDDEEDFFICESAKGADKFKDEYKISDILGCKIDYYICTDTNMSTKEAYENLVGENCTHIFVELIEDTYDFEDSSEVDCCKDDKCNCDDDCCDCNECNCQKELSDEEQVFCDITAETVSKILQTNGCPNCIFDVLIDYGIKMRNIGATDMKDMFRCFIDELD